MHKQISYAFLALFVVMCIFPCGKASADRLNQIGWECAQTNEFNGTVTGFLTSVNVTNNLNFVRSGLYSMMVTNPVASTRTGMGYQFASSNNDGPFWMRVYFKWINLPSNSNTVFNVGAATIASNVQQVKLIPSGALEFYTNGQFAARSNFSLSSNTWYRLEFYFDRTPAAGSEQEEFRIYDDATTPTLLYSVLYTNLTIPAGIQGCGMGGNLNGEGVSNPMKICFDDFAVNNSAGSFQNGWVGNGKIIHLQPDGNDGATTWEIGGTTPAASNVLGINEIFPNDAFNFNMSSNNANSVEDFTLIDTPAELGSSDIINTVGVAPRYAGVLAADANKSLNLRIKASAGGTTETASAGAPPNASWRTYNRAGRNYTIMTYDLPGASTTPWTKSTLDTAVAGYSLNPTGSNTGSNLVSTLWMSIDFTPAVAPSSDGEPEGLLNIFP